jgi:hypothetical protein
VRLAAVISGVENCQKWETALDNVFFFSHPLTLEVNERE